MICPASGAMGVSPSIRIRPRSSSPETFESSLQPRSMAQVPSSAETQAMAWLSVTTITSRFGRERLMTAFST